MSDFHHLLTLIGACKQQQEIGCEHRSVTCWSSADCREPKQAQTQRKAQDDISYLASSRLTPVFNELLLYYWLIVMPTQKWLNSNNLDWHVSGLCRSRAERTHIHLPSDRIKNICFSQMWLVESEKSGGGKWKMQKPESRKLKQHHKVEGGAQKLWFNILSSSETSGEECACSAGHMMESWSAFSSDSSSYSLSIRSLKSAPSHTF